MQRGRSSSDSPAPAPAAATELSCRRDSGQENANASQADPGPRSTTIGRSTLVEASRPIRGVGKVKGLTGGERVARRRSGPQATSREGSGHKAERMPTPAATTPTPATTVGGRFRALTAGAQVAAFVKDPEGRYVYANPYMFALFGEQLVSDWRGKSDADIWPADLAAPLRADDEAVMREGAFRATTQSVALPDGPHTFLVMKFPLPTENGRIDVGGVGIDVTQHEQTEAERDRLAAAIAEGAPAGVVPHRGGRHTHLHTRI